MEPTSATPTVSNETSAPDALAAAQPPVANDIPAIGGTLLLPLLFLGLQLSFLAWELFQVGRRLLPIRHAISHHPQLVWPAFRGLATSLYWPALAIDVLLGVLVVLLARSYFRKHHLLPICYLLFLWLTFTLWAVAQLVFPVELFIGAGKIHPGMPPAIRPLLITFVWSIVFVPFFLYSRRVKTTFVHLPVTPGPWTRRLSTLQQYVMKRPLASSLLAPALLLATWFVILVVGVTVRMWLSY